MEFENGDLCVEASNDFALAAAFRGAMALEMGRDWEQRYPGWRDRYAAYFRDRQTGGTAQLFIVFYQRHASGMAIVSFLDTYRTAVLGEQIAYVNGVYVAPQARRMGLARALMREVMGWARSHGCTSIRLRASDAGRPLYASLGFASGTEMELPLRA